MHFGSILSLHEDHFRIQFNFLHDMLIETNYLQQQAKLLYVVNECMKNGAGNAHYQMEQKVEIDFEHFSRPNGTKEISSK